MTVYTIDIPNCPMTMEAPDMDTAIQRCLDVGLDPSLLREAFLPEARQHKEIQEEMQEAAAEPWGESPV